MGLFSTKSDKQKKQDLLDTILYKVPSANTAITWADACEGTLVTGSTGSGKSSGVGKCIAQALLRSGAGMMILCAKNDERENWVDLIQEAAPDRIKDLVIFNKKSGLRFNVLQYELERIGEGAGDVMNAVEALMSLNEQNQNHQAGSSGGGNNERFWDQSLRRLISRSINALRLAGEPVSILNMRKLISDCFKDEEADHFQKLQIDADDESIDPQTRRVAKKELNEWIASNYFLHVLLKISDMSFSPDDEDDVENCIRYFVRDFPKVGEKVSSIVIESFMGIVEPFLNRGILKSQFSHGLSPGLLPENIYQKNSIIIVDFPIKEFGIAGIFAATIMKTTFQAAMERRNTALEKAPKPVGLWIDEYQQFTTSKDAQFQATARSSWVATTYITQNLPGLYPVMGNRHAEAKTKSLLGNLNLKYFASNDNYETNHWASQMIGQHKVDFENLSYDKDMQISKTKNQQLQHKIMPDFFTTLKTGRKVNNHIVEAIVFKAGKLWGKEKKNFALVEFKQR